MKMSRPVTVRAERDEILFGIISQLAARKEVVDLKILRYAAFLAAPPIAREYFAEELAIRLGFKPQSRLLASELVQSCSSPCPAIAASAPRNECR